MKELELSGFGVRGDNFSDCTEAFTSAFTQIASCGGGVLRVGAGVWRTGALALPSGLTLIIEEGAIVSFIPEYERYTDRASQTPRPLVYSRGSENIRITGKGILDGGGAPWWAGMGKTASKEKGTKRPPMAFFEDCKNIIIEDVRLENTPAAALRFSKCHDIDLDGIVIRNPSDSPLTDGLILEACANVVVRNACISGSGAAIAVKAGKGEENRAILIRDTRADNMRSGLLLDGEGGGLTTDLTMKYCVFRGVERVIRAKMRRGWGGVIKNLRFSSLTIKRSVCPIALNMYYNRGDISAKDGCFSLKEQPINEGTPALENILFEYINALGCQGAAAFIAGLPESPIRALVMRNCYLDTDEASPLGPDNAAFFSGLPSIAGKGFRMFSIEEPSLSNVIIHGPKKQFIYV